MLTPELDRFIATMQDVTTAETVPDDAELARITSSLLQDLVLRPGVIPEQFAELSASRRGRGFILHRSPTFAVSSVIWRPGDQVEPHNHQTWGAVAVVSNSIEERRYDVGLDEMLEPRWHTSHGPGAVTSLVPGDDIHSMHNLSRETTVELHVYGRDISRMTRRAWSFEGDDPHDLPSGKYLNC